MNTLYILGILGLVIFITLVYILRKRKALLFLLFLLAGLAAWFGYKEFVRTHKDLAVTSADFKLQAKELINEFDKNDSTATKKYLGKILEVSGTVKEVRKDETGFYTIALGEEGILTSVRCSMDSVHQGDAANLSSGSSATIRGACTGFNKDEMGILGSDINLNRAVLVSKK